MIVFVGMLTLYGCIAPRVVVNKTIYYGPANTERDSIYVVAYQDALNNTLEFKNYKSKIDLQLKKVGYEIANDPESAKFLALVSYGIDSGQTKTGSVPIVGQTGGGTTFHSGTVSTLGGGFGSYSGTSYTMPTFGIVGSMPVSNTLYTRNIAIDIVRASTLNEETPERIFEIRAQSRGRCSVINEVFDEILEGTFKNFPGENGKNQRVEIQPVTDC